MRVYDAKIAVTLPDEKILDIFMGIMIDKGYLVRKVSKVKVELYLICK